MPMNQQMREDADVVLQKLGRRVEDQDVADWPILTPAAEAYALHYQGTFSFMLDMNNAMRRYGHLTPAQVRGTINCLRNELAREEQQRMRQASPTGRINNVNQPRLQNVPNRSRIQHVSEVRRGATAPTLSAVPQAEQAVWATMTTAERQRVLNTTIAAPIEDEYVVDLTNVPLPPPERVPAGSIASATYTVVMGANRRTIRVKDVSANSTMRVDPGTRIVEYLSGPDNERSFTGFAFLTPNNELRVWRAFRFGFSPIIDAINFLLTGPDSRRSEATETYALMSGRCARCGRTLTVPASIAAGFGPECVTRIGE